MFTLHHSVICVPRSQPLLPYGKAIVHLRLKEHKRALTSSDGVYYTSAVAEHAIKNNHHIDWNNAKVVDYQQNIHQKCYLESWYIRRSESPMNREIGTHVSKLVYSNNAQNTFIVNVCNFYMPTMPKGHNIFQFCVPSCII